MKRIFTIFLAVFLIFALTACGESVNMNTLTHYREKDFEAQLQISLYGKEYFGTLRKNGEKLFLSLKNPAALEDFIFVLEESGVSIVADGVEIPLGAEELLHFSRIYALFFVPVAGAWKIEKARPGGVDIYICENESTVLYIDAHSRLPLKIISGGNVANILSFSPAQ